jgi:hypothetical protein
MHGQMPGQMLHYQPQGIQSEGQTRPWVFHWKPTAACSLKYFERA